MTEIDTFNAERERGRKSQLLHRASPVVHSVWIKILLRMRVCVCV